MTINWGHKITLVFIAFASLMLFMVYKSMQSNYQLVTKEYYKDELAYQQVIDGTNRANKLSSSVFIEKKQSEVIIQFPEEVKGKNVEGEAWFYCINNNRNDKKIKLTVNNDAKQIMDAAIFNPGNYKVKITWKENNINYYSEISFIIQ